MKRYCSHGFTLVELLVVITIIAILSAIGLVSYQVVLKNGRDATRQANLKTIQSALEQYFADQLFYPLYSLGNCPGRGDLRFNCALTNSGGGRVYLNLVSTDPLSSNPPYCYLSLPPACDNSAVNKCTSYELYAKLENAPAGNYRCGPNSSYNLKVIPP